ncbi:hypothetical protein MNBD_IGNAVI01-1772 [hydrothermal vent metagenome]|uniref:Uncharacterized protein n=1 Tax=hydrothermal vent metagenome TaxID=652676 RepID=A0A3B1BJM1_9ZZZZ
MKKASKIILIAAILSSLSLFSGCEDLGNIPLNIPIKVEFTLSGSETSASETVTFCLNQYQEWNDNKDKIQSVKFLSAAYWTLDYSPTALKGTINASLKDQNGLTLFSINLPNTSPGDYISEGYKLELTKDEIDAFNAYLNNLQEDPSCSTPTFTAEISVTNVTGGTPYTIRGKVELILETEVSTN